MMHQYQKKVVDWMLKVGNGYLAIDMGLGKTRCVLEYLKLCHFPRTLVVAPLQVALTTWPNEIKKWMPEVSFSVIHGNDKKEILKKSGTINIINYEGLQWLFEHAHPSFFKNMVLILDEATKVKNRGAARTKLLIKKRALFSNCFCLSATPTPQGIWDLWAQFRILDDGETLGQRWSMFEFRYLTVNPYTYNVVARPGAKEDISQRIRPKTISLKAEDYLALPDYVYNDIMLELPSELREKYKQLETDMVWELSQEQVVTATNAAILGNKLRQFLQGAIYTDSGVTEEIHMLKTMALKQVLEELNGTPTLVPILFRSEITMIRKLIGEAPLIYGGTSVKEREKLLNVWNDGKLPFLLVHPASISHGVNLQAGGHYITWLGLTWSYEQYHQVNGRLRRQGQKYPVVVNRILFRDTKDEAVARALLQKSLGQEAVLRALRA